jgi:hypothetical protein
MIKYGQAFKKPFTDIGKLIVGIILSAVPIINWISQGFMLESSGLGKSKPSSKMPSWDNLGELLFKGLTSYIIMIIYMIPAIAVFTMAIGYAGVILPTSMVGFVPGETFSSIMSGQASPSQLRAVFAPIVGTAIAMVPVIILGLILLLAAIYVIPMAIMNFMKKRRFAAAFDTNLILGKALTGRYFIVWLVSKVLSLILFSILFWIPWLGWAAAMFLSGVMTYSLYGQVYRER